jgi:outer membrane protein OmpA-like peptidoglycan-associated protein
LIPNKNYNISIYAEGYLFHSENIFIDSIFYHEHVKDIKLEKVKVGSKTILNNVFFDFDKSTLRKESFVELDGIVKLLKENVKLKVGIYGHTDNRGSGEYNLNLSQERANSVVNYLIQKGISKDRLIAKGMGETQPIDTNDTAMGRQSNRRIEFVILSD